MAGVVEVELTLQVDQEAKGAQAEVAVTIRGGTEVED